MSWKRDPLWAKTLFFVEQSLKEDRNDPAYGLWSSFALESLARTAISAISPTLLADPDKDQKNLLYALDKADSGAAPRSLDTVKVFDLCQRLIKGFTKEIHMACMALVNRRNEELHTGSAAFAAYPTSLWAASYYEACDILCRSIDETLETLFGPEESAIAAKVREGNRNDLKQKVSALIASHKKVFEGKTKEAKEQLLRVAHEESDRMAFKGKHRVDCPSCGGKALVAGDPFGRQNISHEDDEIVIRQAVTPSAFSCSSCGLNLDGYAELEACGLAGHYTRRTTYTPSEYYGLIDPDDLQHHVEEYLADHMREYDNE